MKILMRIILPAFLFSVIAATAQKLPNVQAISLRAPAGIKIDGKAIEWDNKFQAFNNSTEVFYTIANDDENLYLTVQAIIPQVINRVVGGGVTLTIQKSGKKTDNNNISITYPYTDSKTFLIFNLKLRQSIASDTSVNAADSAMVQNNKLLEQKCKWIATTGIKDLDSLTSIYNDEGIKAVGIFDKKKIYTIELSVSLKHLGLSTKDAAKFTYNIRVNGPKPTPIPVLPGNEEITAMLNASAARKNAPTDFWGEYTLAKK